MSTLIDPNGFADAARGVNPEIVVETGHHIPSEAELDPSASAETIGEELERLEKNLSDAYIEGARQSEAKTEDGEFTPAQETRLEKLLENHNRTEALRIMGIAPPETIAR